MDKQVIEVVAGVIFDSRQRILACDRPADKAGAGFWEFPGGKIEQNESCAQALERELAEELAIKVTVLDEMYRLELSTPQKKRLVLHFLRALIDENSRIVPQENQHFRWLEKSELFSVKWLESDLEFVEFLAR